MILHNCYYENNDKKKSIIDHEIKNIDIPSSWVWGRLKSICYSIQAGGDKPNVFSKTKTNECTIPIFSNGIENDGLFGYTNKAKITLPSLTVSARGTIGYSCVRNVPYTPIVRLLSIIPFEKISLDYLQIAFSSLLEIGEGTSTPQLTVPSISNKLIPIPPFKEQLQIVDKYRRANNILIEIQKENIELNQIISQTKNTLLDRIFNSDSSYKSYYEKISTIGAEIVILDSKRKPINKTERANKKIEAKNLYPYYGATGLVDYIDDYLIDGEFVLVGEDGAPFLNKNKDKAYIVKGKIWVNNHAHILSSKNN